LSSQTGSPIYENRLLNFCKKFQIKILLVSDEISKFRLSLASNGVGLFLSVQIGVISSETLFRDQANPHATASYAAVP
jgi:hypothetical protein